MGVTERLLHLLQGLVSQHRADLQLLDVSEHEVGPLARHAQLGLGVRERRQHSLKLEIVIVSEC